MHRPSSHGATYLQGQRGGGDSRRNGKKKEPTRYGSEPTKDPYRVVTPQCTPHERPPQSYHISAGAPAASWSRGRPISHSPYVQGTSASERRQPRAHALTDARSHQSAVYSSYEPTWAELSERYGGPSAGTQSSRASGARAEDDGGWMRMRYERYTVAALNYNYHRLPGEPFDETYDGKLGSVYTFVTEALAARADWVRLPAARDRATDEVWLPGSFDLLLGTAQGKGLKWAQLGRGMWPPPLVNYYRNFECITRKVASHSIT